MLQQLRELLAASNELQRLPARLSELPHLNVVNIQVRVRVRFRVRVRVRNRVRVMVRLILTLTSP